MSRPGKDGGRLAARNRKNPFGAASPDGEPGHTLSVADAVRRCRWIAVDVNAAGATYWSAPTTFLGVLFQSAMLLLRTAGKSQHYRADVVIVPQIAHLRPDEIAKMPEFIELGEEAARAKIDEIKKLVFETSRNCRRSRKD